MSTTERFQTRPSGHALKAVRGIKPPSFDVDSSRSRKVLVLLFGYIRNLCGQKSFGLFLSLSSRKDSGGFLPESLDYFEFWPDAPQRYSGGHEHRHAARAVVPRFLTIYRTNVRKRNTSVPKMSLSVRTRKACRHNGTSSTRTRRACGHNGTSCTRTRKASTHTRCLNVSPRCPVMHTRSPSVRTPGRNVRVPRRCLNVPCPRLHVPRRMARIPIRNMRAPEADGHTRFLDESPRCPVMHIRSRNGCVPRSCFGSACAPRVGRALLSAPQPESPDVGTGRRPHGALRTARPTSIRKSFMAIALFSPAHQPLRSRLRDLHFVRAWHDLPRFAE